MPAFLFYSMTENILVVCGAGGIGSAIVQKYKDLGENAFSADIAYKETLPNCFYVDVANPDSVRALSHMLDASRINVNHLVSLAGGACNEFGKDITQVPVKTIEDSIQLNLTAHIYLLREIVPLMQQGNRSITLVSSINAIQDYALPAYSAAKAGLLGLVKATTTELGEKGIRINAILPGTVPTPRTQKEPKNFETLLKTSALGRLTTPEEIANAVYATTHLLTAMTGQSIVVDCGQTVKTTKYVKE